MKNGEFTDGNALLVDDARNHSDWAKYVKKLVQNPNMRIDMGERLYEHVSQRYSLEVVTKTRAEFYLSIV
jgi:glycosyltransferase involved in cell wall biosynthesis